MRKIVAKGFDEEVSFEIEKNIDNKEYVITDDKLGKIKAKILYSDDSRVDVEIDGKKYVVVIDSEANLTYVNGVPLKISINEHLITKTLVNDISNFLLKNNENSKVEKGEIRAPLSGKIISVKVKVGDKVHKGQTLLIMESMKMLNEIKSQYDGIVEEVAIREGNVVKKNQLLIRINPSS